MTQIIEQHSEPEMNPLFIYLATQTMHAPVEVPSHYSDMYAAYTKTYAVSNGMVTVTDEILRNVTAALTKRGMWARTLIIHLSDNVRCRFVALSVSLIQKVSLFQRDTR